MAYPDVPIWLELTRLGRDFAFSGARALLPNHSLSDIERYCMFIGAPRNGHSLVGSLLDAHEEMVIAHELGVAKLKTAHFSKRQIELLLVANSKRHAAQGRRHIHYSHAVPEQWQGRHRQLRVLGDKHGEGFLLSVQARPWLADAVIEGMRPCYFIHVIRNPFDAIASIVGGSKRGQSLESAIGNFDGLYATLTAVTEKLQPGHLHEVHFESFLRQPREELGKICSFLGLETNPRYLDSCVSIVLDELEDHRDSVEWDQLSLRKARALIDKYPFLSNHYAEKAGA